MNSVGLREFWVDNFNHNLRTITYSICGHKTMTPPSRSTSDVCTIVRHPARTEMRKTLGEALAEFASRDAGVFQGQLV